MCLKRACLKKTLWLEISLPKNNKDVSGVVEVVVVVVGLIVGTVLDEGGMVRVAALVWTKSGVVKVQVVVMGMNVGIVVAEGGMVLVTVLVGSLSGVVVVVVDVGIVVAITDVKLFFLLRLM